MSKPGEDAGEDPADPMALVVADLYQAAGLSRRLGEQIAKGEGQSQARWQVLSVLSDGPRTVAQAARRLGTARQAVQRITRELVQDGLLAAHDNPDHRTSPLFDLTAQGRAILERINLAAADVHREQLSRLDPDEVAQLHLSLRRLITVLDD